MKISLFVPVFNEEDIVVGNARIIRRTMEKSGFDYEMLIVNDGSTDGTKSAIARLKEPGSKISSIDYDSGPSRRENLAQSFKMARGDIVAFVDLDLIASLRFLPPLIDEVLNGYDIATGSRYMPGAKIQRKRRRYILSVVYNFLVRIIFRTGVSDHMCGLKAFKKDVILGLVGDMGPDETLSRGIFWDTELLIRARRKGLSIKEIPIWWKEREKSALSFGREVHSLMYILKFIKKGV